MQTCCSLLLSGVCGCGEPHWSAEGHCRCAGSAFCLSASCFIESSPAALCCCPACAGAASLAGLRTATAAALARFPAYCLICRPSAKQQQSSPAALCCCQACAGEASLVGLRTAKAALARTPVSLPVAPSYKVQSSRFHLLLSAAVRRVRVRRTTLVCGRPLPLRWLSFLPHSAAQVLIYTRIAYLAHLQTSLSACT